MEDMALVSQGSSEGRLWMEAASQRRSALVAAAETGNQDAVGGGGEVSSRRCPSSLPVPPTLRALLAFSAVEWQRHGFCLLALCAHIL